MNGPVKPKLSLIQIAFPQQATIVFGAALCVGFALIGLPLLMAMDATRGDLILCAGIAIVLAAFGGQATVQVGGIIMAGAAAISIGLFIYLQSIKMDHYTRGSISGINALNYDVILKTRNNILGSVIPVGSNLARARYDFVVFKSELDADTVEVLVSVKGGNTEVGSDKVARIASSHFEKYFGTNRRLDWELKQKRIDNSLEFEVVDNSSQKVISTEHVASIPGKRTVALEAVKGLFSRLATVDFIRTAQAQELTPQRLASLIEQLKSDDTTTRRGTRDALANLMPVHVPALMSALRAEAKNYRVKLGIAVALSEMLRQDRSRSSAISEQLSNSDLDFLLTLTGDPDRTVRIYATQFLSDLGDPRLAKIGTDKALAESDSKAVHNQLLTIQQSIEKVPASDREAINRSLDNIKSKTDPETKLLIDKLQQKMR